MSPALPLRSVADGVLPRRRGPHGAVQLGAGQAAGRHVRAAHRGHRRGPQPPGVDAGDHRCASPGSASPPTIRTFEGPYFQSSYAAAHVAAAERLLRGGPRLLLRSHAGADRGAGQGERQAGLRRLFAGPRARARRPAGCCASGFPTASTVDRRRDPRRRHVRARAPSRTSCCCAATARRCSCSPTSSTTSRWASPTSCAARSTCRTRPSSSCCGRRSAQEPPVWAHVPVLVNEARKKLSKRRDKVALESVPRRGLPRRGDGQLPDDARMGADRRRRGVGDRAVVGDRGVVPPRRRHPFAGVLRHQEAGGVQRRVHPHADARRVRRRLRAVPAAGVRPQGLRGDGAARADACRDAGRGCQRWSTS